MAVTVAVQGDAHGERDLPEVVTRPEDASLAERRLRDPCEPREQDEEAISRLAFLDEHGSRVDLFALHLLGELSE